MWVQSYLFCFERECLLPKFFPTREIFLAG